MRSYKELVLSHEGFYNALYNDLQKKINITESYKTLNNRGKGIDYELYKIIKNSLPSNVIMKSYRNLFLSREGITYWLAYYSNEIPMPTQKED